MCGIAGYFNTFFESNLELIKLSKNILNTIKKRGPDDHGFWNDDHVHLIHSRLSIIDISNNAKQPMTSESGRYVIIYNGEIYNFKNLKLSYFKDHNFRTNSETEVLLKLFETFGIHKTIPKLNGMFALAVFDKLLNKLFIARDKMGQKPLYYYYDQKNFCFSSDLKSFYEFKKIDLSLNISSFKEFLNLGYFPQQTTPLKNIFKLMPGYIGEIRKDEKNIIYKEYQYYSIKKNFKNDFNHKSKSIDIKNIDQIFTDVVSDNLVADVKKGIFLSSGMDSTLIACYANKVSEETINTFTLGFDDNNYDESYNAELIARSLKSNHNNFIVSENEIKDAILIMDDIYSEPFGDTSQIPTYLLSKFSSIKIKVAISGDGGDELFGGYNRYQYLRLISHFNKIGLNKLTLYNSFKLPFFQKIFTQYFQAAQNKIDKIEALMKSDLKNDFDLYQYIISNKFTSDDINYKFLSPEHKLSKESYNKLDDIWMSNYPLCDKMMISDLVNYLPDDILVKTDRASMHTGLEVRSPFLDDRVVKLSSNLDSSQKVSYFSKKKILQKLLYKNFNITVSSSKKGFAIPLKKYLSNDLFFLVKKFLNVENIKDQGIFSINFINELIYQFQNTNNDNSSLVWNFISLQRFIDNHEKNCNKC